MKRLPIIIAFFLAFYGLRAQVVPEQKTDLPQFSIGWGGGISGAYADRTFNYGISCAASFDYHIAKGIYLQTVPRFSYFFRWREFYLNFPLHIRKQFNDRLSVFAGPTFNLDVGNFRSFGLSGGLGYNFGKDRKSSLILSAFSHTLYSYDIDYFFVPVSLSYSYTLWSK